MAQRGSRYLPVQPGNRQQQNYNDTQDTPTGLLDDSVNWEQQYQYDQYNNQYPQEPMPQQQQGYDQYPQNTFEIVKAGGIQRNPDMDVQLGFVAFNGDLLMVLIGVGDVGGKSFIKLKRWYDQQLPNLPDAEPQYIQQLEAHIDSLYNTMCLLGTDDVHFEWIMPPQ